jgi:hypothetical protein
VLFSGAYSIFMELKDRLLRGGLDICLQIWKKCPFTKEENLIVKLVEKYGRICPHILEL